MKLDVLVMVAIGLAAVGGGAGVANAGGEYGRATCYFVDRSGVRSHVQKCRAALDGNMYDVDGAIWLADGRRFSFTWRTNNDDGSVSRESPRLHNISRPFRGDPFETMCAPIRNSGLSICATGLKDSQRPPPAY